MVIAAIASYLVLLARTAIRWEVMSNKRRIFSLTVTTAALVLSIHLVSKHL